MKLTLTFIFLTLTLAAQVDLFKLAPGSAAFADGLTAAVPKGAVEKGEAWVGRGPDFIFAVKHDGAPSISIDEAPPVKMKKAGALWIHKATLKTGTIHRFSYVVDGQPFGGKTTYRPSRLTTMSRPASRAASYRKSFCIPARSTKAC